MLVFGIFCYIFFNKIIAFDLFNSIHLSITNKHLLKKYSINLISDLPTNQQIIDHIRKLNQNTANILEIIDGTNKKCTEAERIVQIDNDDEKESNLPELQEYGSRMSILREKISQYLNNNEDFDRVIRGAIFEYKEGIIERKRRIEILLDQKLGADMRIQRIDFTHASNRNNIAEFLLSTGIPIRGMQFYSYAQLHYISRELETLIECAEHAHHLCEATMFVYDAIECFNFIRMSTSFKHFYDWSLEAIRLDSQLSHNTNLVYDLESIDGAPGSDGYKGETGDAGDAGDNIFQKGIKGQQGIKGDVGEIGEQGDIGDEGYVSMNILYYEKNYPQIWYWVNETKCPTFIKHFGLKGLSGEDGRMGAKGNTGEQGEIGNKGDPGESGEPIIELIESGDDGERGDDIDCVDEMLQDVATVKGLTDISNDPNNILNPKWWDDDVKEKIRARVTLNNKMEILKKILRSSQ